MESVYIQEDSVLNELDKSASHPVNKIPTDRRKNVYIYSDPDVLEKPLQAKCDEKYHQFKVVSQNVRGLNDNTKLESIIDMMEMNRIDAYLLQETWLPGTRIIEIRDFTIFLHSISKKGARRGERGVGIILSPKFTKFYEDAGGAPPIHTPEEPTDCIGGRYIQIKLKLSGFFSNLKGAFRKKKKVKKNLSINLASAYTSGDIKEQEMLQDFITDRIQRDKNNQYFFI